jgi:hypothetical protein
MPIINVYSASDRLPAGIDPMPMLAQEPRTRVAPRRALDHSARRGASWHVAKPHGTEDPITTGPPRSRCDPQAFEDLFRGPGNYL